MEIRGCCDNGPSALLKKEREHQGAIFLNLFFPRPCGRNTSENKYNCAPHLIRVSSRDKEKTHTGGNIKLVSFCDRPERFPSQRSLPATFIYFYPRSVSVSTFKKKEKKKKPRERRDKGFNSRQQHFSVFP